MILIYRSAEKGQHKDKAELTSVLIWHKRVVFKVPHPVPFSHSSQIPHLLGYDPKLYIMTNLGLESDPFLLILASVYRRLSGSFQFTEPPATEKRGIVPLAYPYL